MVVSLIWCTPNGDDLISYMARVSNSNNQNNKETAPKLIKYLIAHKHWSPFEMVNACVKIETTRDISHQILRHRSFSFQEFSGRYSEYRSLQDVSSREVRLQDLQNRQHSISGVNPKTESKFKNYEHMVCDFAGEAYRHLISLGVAREVARALLPEGYTPTSMYMNGNLRSWIHYWDVRCAPETQKEHRLIAEQTRKVILPMFPMIGNALE